MTRQHARLDTNLTRGTKPQYKIKDVSKGKKLDYVFRGPEGRTLKLVRGMPWRPWIHLGADEEAAKLGSTFF